MAESDPYRGRSDYLKRLPAENYRGQAFVHWSMTIEDRKTGWLVPIFHYKIREILTHTTFRHGLCAPIYCCMPDHIHLLWIGILECCDQRVAARYFRKQVNPILEKLGVRFQKQPYDRVLREEERQHNGLEDLVHYIARNPERSGLVARDAFQNYPYTGCLMPGYPELRIWDVDYWDRFWRIYAHLAKHGLIRGLDDQDDHAEIR